VAAEITILVEGYVKNDGESVGSTISLVKSKHVNLIVDPGLVKERGEITHGLLKEGLRAEDITHVFITHHHPDHTVNIGMFPNAKVIDVDSIYYKDTWLEHERNYRITDEIAVIPTPGHTMEDATLLVRTEEGVVAFTHAWWREDLTPANDPLAEDRRLLKKSRQKIMDSADFIVPSHGGMKKL